MDDKGVERILLTVGTSIALLGLYRLVEWFMRRSRSIPREMAGGNLAGHLLSAGHALAVLLLLPGIVKNCVSGESLSADAISALLFGSAGVVVIELAGALGVKLLVRGSLEREVADGNVAAGVAGAANYVAIGVLASRAIGGTSAKELGISIAFFALSIVTLTIFVGLFRAITTYDDEEQVRGRNLAAAISYAGVSVSVALITARALEGKFTTWEESLTGYALVAVCALILYPVRQIVVQGLLLWRAPTLRGGALDRAIGLERKVGLAVLESFAYVATAITITEFLV
ncbi:MAG: DUF350 domain-containing protein [Polyangiaceae bacterium]